MAALNGIGQRLVVDLTGATRADDKLRRELSHAEKINVVGAGGSLTAAYEQLRNAAENTEEHLLLQNAIRRFYKQLFITRDEALVRTSGNELAVELTFAGYVANDSLAKFQLEDISRLAIEHYRLYEKLLKKRSISSDTSNNWVLDTLSVEVEGVINQHLRDRAFTNFSYEYLQTIVPPETVIAKGDAADEYGAALLIAVHRALLKSNTAVIRTALLQRYQVPLDDAEAYATFNKRVDFLISSPMADKLYRMVDRQGAPLRIMRRMMDDQADFVN